MENTLRIVCISDTHNQLDRMQIPDGDVLVHAGDLTGSGKPHEVMMAGQQLAKLPHKHKVVIAGNHDFLFQRNPQQARELLCVDSTIHYLQDSSVKIQGINFYGSPWQPEFFDWAFNLPRGEKLASVWAKIPDDTNVLITHGPPFGILDYVAPNRYHATGENVGCADLLNRVKRLACLELHVFGHIHCGYGMRELEEESDSTLSKIFVNAASLGEDYRTQNAAVVIDLPAP